MPDATSETAALGAEFDFLKGHIAATMTLIHALIDQGTVDRKALDAFFAGFVDQLPHNRQTLALRLVLEQWRQGLRDGQEVGQLNRRVFEVVRGGLVNDA
ncbi:hypothetical protein GWI72_05710 [Microvirga tunisiensis]|uniref:Uncharacterized protein n=2 Tax=Pannonibacter tanglangensis TaxID=2750084 RepID=A0A7X5J7Q9_9HYPH|nr:MULTISPECIES: hypothetical protein [unclassified Pannonibacter]NBN62092.1 hypothetical protein [Pannonibacter sp. XCT-34]NBN77762.1 hypothetical protein [Pannonibacter sp. XCT-53]